MFRRSSPRQLWRTFHLLKFYHVPRYFPLMSDPSVFLLLCYSSSRRDACIIFDSNKSSFDNLSPFGDLVDIKWSRRLNKTAGLTYLKRRTGESQSLTVSGGKIEKRIATIELSVKVLDEPGRLYNTLARNMPGYCLDFRDVVRTGITSKHGLRSFIAGATTWKLPLPISMSFAASTTTSAQTVAPATRRALILPNRLEPG